MLPLISASASYFSMLQLVIIEIILTNFKNITVILKRLSHVWNYFLLEMWSINLAWKHIRICKRLLMHVSTVSSSSIGCEWQIRKAVWVRSIVDPPGWLSSDRLKEHRSAWPTGLRWVTTARPPRTWIAGGPAAPKTTSASSSEKRKYSNGNRKAVNHKPKVSYVMLVRQWLVLYWWRGKSFLPFRRRIATVIPLTCTLNRQMPFNCQKQPIVWSEWI